MQSIVGASQSSRKHHVHLQMCMYAYVCRPHGMVAGLWRCQEEKIADTTSERMWPRSNCVTNLAARCHKLPITRRSIMPLCGDPRGTRGFVGTRAENGGCNLYTEVPWTRLRKCSEESCAGLCENAIHSMTVTNIKAVETTWRAQSEVPHLICCTRYTYIHMYTQTAVRWTPH